MYMPLESYINQDVRNFTGFHSKDAQKQALLFNGCCDLQNTEKVGRVGKCMAVLFKSCVGLGGRTEAMCRKTKQQYSSITDPETHVNIAFYLGTVIN